MRKPRVLSVVAGFFISFGVGGCGVADDAESTDVSETGGALAAGPAYLVSFTGDAIPSNADALVAAAGGTVVARYASVGALLARSPRASFASSLRTSSGIESVGATRALNSALEPVRGNPGPSRAAPRRRPSPGDPLSFRQWNMDQIHAPQARAINPGRRSVLVGVMDTGIDVTHPDMVGQVNNGAGVSCTDGVPNPAMSLWANDFFGHGTHVAGIIAAARNGVGVVGVAPGVRLASLKVVNDDGLIFPEAFVCGMDWAVSHGVDLLNASFTVDPFFFYCTDDPDQLAIIKTVRRAVLAAARKDVTLVAATQNFFTDLAGVHGTAPGSQCKVLPVQLPTVIGVSAVGVTQLLSNYSDYGFGAVDVTAPGGDNLIPDPAVTDRVSSGQVVSSIPPNSFFYALSAQWDGQVQDCSSGTCSTYAYLQGTSQASPHAAGVAALALSRFGRMGPEALLGVLRRTATPLACPPSPYDPGGTGTPATCSGPPGRNNFYGAGEVDALAVVR